MGSCESLSQEEATLVHEQKLEHNVPSTPRRETIKGRAGGTKTEPLPSYGVSHLPPWSRNVARAKEDSKSLQKS